MLVLSENIIPSAINHLEHILNPKSSINFQNQQSYRKCSLCFEFGACKQHACAYCNGARERKTIFIETLRPGAAVSKVNNCADSMLCFASPKCTQTRSLIHLHNQIFYNKLRFAGNVTLTTLMKV